MTPPIRNVLRTLAGLAGLCLLIWFVAGLGFRNVGAALSEAGVGVLVVAVFHAVPLALDALGWVTLTPVLARSGWVRLLAIRWASESINNLLPVAQVGGDVMRVHLAARGTASPVTVAAGVIVDFTGGFVAKILLAGASLLFFVVPGSAGSLAGDLWYALAILTALGAAFLAMQAVPAIGESVRRAASRVRPRAMSAALLGVGNVSTAVAGLYRERDRVAWAWCLRTLAWVVGAGEVWLGLWYLDSSIGLAPAIAFHGLTFLARSAGFFVPGALGIQEGGYVLIGAIMGIPAETALALALIRRARELLFGLPGLAVLALLRRSNSG